MAAAAGNLDAVVVPAEEKPLWLTAWRDFLANVKTTPSCLEFADLNGDGDNKLVIGDMQRKLKVFGSTCLLVEGPIIDLPVSVCSFYMDYSQDVHRPLLAVASGPFVFMYKQMRPYYKFTLPPIDLDAKEIDIWGKLKVDAVTIPEAVEALEQLKETGAALSTRSMDLLSFDSDGQRRRHIDATKGTPLVQLTVITCMVVINKDRETAGGLGCLCLGTEGSNLLLLDRTCASVSKKIPLPSVPTQLLASGMVDIEYRVLALCRNGRVYITKNGELLNVVIECETIPVALSRVENQIVVAAGNSLHYFNVKGARLATITVPGQIMSVVPLSQENLKHNKAICVAVGKEIRTYVGKALLNIIKLPDDVVAIKVGRYGREESTLVAILKSGTLLVYMLPRSATLDVSSAPVIGPPPEQDIPIRVPKRTTLYVEQTKRERDFCIDMHRTFQRDLCKLRLQTARAYVKILTDNNSSLAATSGNVLRLTANVQGLGPLFRVKLSVHNVSIKPLLNIVIAFTYDTETYRLPHPQVVIPVLLPGTSYPVEVPVYFIAGGGHDGFGGDASAGGGGGGGGAAGAAPSDTIRIFVCNPSSAMPLVTASVQLPITNDAMMSL